MIFLKILLIISFVYIVNCQNVSPRQVIEEYLYNNGCKDRLLNIMILSIFNGKAGLNAVYGNFNQINEILSTHMPQFKKSNVLKCYDVLLKKYLDDNRPSKIQ